MFRRQEATPPKPRVQRLAATAPLRDHHDVAGQIIARAAKAVVEPCAHAWMAKLLCAGVDVGDCRVVVDRLSVDTADECHLVGERGDVRQNLAVIRAALPVLFELKHRRDTWERLLPGRHAGDSLALADGFRQLDAVNLADARLVVVHVDVRRAAGEEQVNHPLDLGHEMRIAQRAAVASSSVE